MENLKNVCATKTEIEDNELLEYCICYESCEKNLASQSPGSYVGPKSILMAGGTNGYETLLSSIEVLSNDESLANKNIRSLPFGITWDPLLFLNGDDLLFCGGIDSAYRLNTKCLKYDKDGWKIHSNLNKNRTFASAVSTSNGAYIFGGDFSKDTYEFLPKNSSKWMLGQSRIQRGFVNGCAVTIPGKPEIFLIGGEKAPRRILTFNVDGEYFIEEGVSLQRERISHACANIPGTNLILIMGGFDERRNTHKTTEIFDTESKTITLGNPMNVERNSYTGVITVNNEDRVALFGGTQYRYGSTLFDTFLEMVETLNPKTMKWEVSDMKLAITRNEFASVTVSNDFISKQAN